MHIILDIRTHTVEQLVQIADGKSTSQQCSHTGLIQSVMASQGILAVPHLREAPVNAKILSGPVIAGHLWTLTISK